jgi:hypothetical protein
MIRFRNFLPVVAVLAVGAMLWAPNQAQAVIRLDFGPVVGATIKFDSTDPAGAPAPATGTFEFTKGILPADSSFTFIITSHSGNNTLGLGALGLKGDITGKYNIGPIATVGTTQQAAVADGAGATHKFSITDGAGFKFEGDVDWILIRTTGIGGLINVDGDINLSGLTYGGTNADLLQLLAEASPPGGGVATISFQFTGDSALTVLTSPNPVTGAERTHESSYSGSVSSVPAPPALILVGLGGVSFGFAHLIRRRKAAKVA